MEKYFDEIEFDDEEYDDLDSDLDYPEGYLSSDDEDDLFQNKMRMKSISKKLNFNKTIGHENWKDEKPYSPIKPSDLPLEKYLQTKKSMKLKESELETIIKKVLKEEFAEPSNYMFFSNLRQMKRQIDMMLEMDTNMVDDILNNGHDWADDHVTEAKTNMDQVFDFLMNETKKQSQYVDFEDIQEGRKKTGTKLCSRGKAAAKSKFKVYPSAYANGYAVQVCKGKMPGLDGKKHCSGSYC